MRGRGGMAPLTAGLIALAVIVLGVYAAFIGKYPWSGGYELQAVFQSSNNIQKRSPVRIAGVEVGKVTKVEGIADSAASLVTMSIKDEALPIHRDAELKIRPRIFLEGNFFVELEPGTAGSPELASGGRIPLAQTTIPVQIDQVLGALPSDTRTSLQKLIVGYGDALNGKPQPGEDDDQDPSTKGETAGESLNDSLDSAPRALRGTAIVNDALLGTEPDDLSALIAAVGDVSAQLASREERLKDLITNFNTTMAAFADEAGNLRRTVAVLPDTLDAANRALGNLNDAFPATRALARELIPGVRETPETVNASFPWIAETRKLLSPAELQGLARDLSPATRDLSILTDQSLRLFPQVDLVSRCMYDVILPTGDVAIEDPPLTTGVANYKEFWQALPALASESQNFDGNGQYTRFQVGGGENQVSTGRTTGGGEPLFGNALYPPLGTRPAMPARKPPYNRSKPCYQNGVPDLNGARTGGGP